VCFLCVLCPEYGLSPLPHLLSPSAKVPPSSQVDLSKTNRATCHHPVFLSFPPPGDFKVVPAWEILVSPPPRQIACHDHLPFFPQTIPIRELFSLRFFSEELPTRWGSGKVRNFAGKTFPFTSGSPTAGLCCPDSFPFLPKPPFAS